MQFLALLSSIAVRVSDLFIKMYGLTIRIKFRVIVSIIK